MFLLISSDFKYRANQLFLWVYDVDAEERKVREKLCKKRYRERHRTEITKHKKEYYLLNRKRILEHDRKYNVLHREYRRSQSCKYREHVRFEALRMVGRGIIRCSECGCDDIRILEINHKNGGGTKEVKGCGNQFYLDIVKGRRVIDDLNLLCKVCNQVYYLKLKYGVDYSVKYVGGKKVAV